jgi:O-antigen/teichoic acid export membrane protein
VNSIAAPKFAQCHGVGDAEGLRKTAQLATATIFWSSAPVLLVFLLFPSPILGIFGREFREGAAALRLLALGQFVNAASGSVGCLLQMTGRQRAYRNVVIAAVVVNLALNVTLVPRYGMNGAAFAGMVGVIMLNVIPFFLIRRYFGFLTFSPSAVFFLKKRGGGKS